MQPRCVMPDFLGSLVAFIVAISVLVAVHEFGHFWVARRLGFKVLRFSIGFGKPLWKWVGRDPDRVEYWLSSIPLGGYVKILDEREGEVAAHERSRAFNQRPIPHRIVVLLAGPAFNFLFALVAYWVLFVTGVPGIRPIVDSVAPDSVAALNCLENACSRSPYSTRQPDSRSRRMSPNAADRSASPPAMT